MLQKTLAIATSAGMVIIEPTQYVLTPKYSVALKFPYRAATSEMLIVPIWNTPMKDPNAQARQKLRDRCMDSRVLGLVSSGEAELLLIYECK